MERVQTHVCSFLQSSRNQENMNIVCQFAPLPCRLREDSAPERPLIFEGSGTCSSSENPQNFCYSGVAVLASMFFHLMLKKAASAENMVPCPPEVFNGAGGSNTSTADPIGPGRTAFRQVQTLQPGPKYAVPPSFCENSRPTFPTRYSKSPSAAQVRRSSRLFR